jgi:cobalt-zinc-cadmium efflux system membrane fusion protein
MILPTIDVRKRVKRPARRTRALLSALAASVLLVACGNRDAALDHASATTRQQDRVPPRSYRVETVVERLAPINVVTAPGKIEANSNRIARVLPPVGGRVLQVLVKFGDPVVEKQPIVVLESPESDVAVSAVLQAEASLSQAKSALAKAAADLERMQDLYAKSAVARKEVLQADNEYAQAQGSVKHAEATLRQALRRLDLLDIKKDEFGQKIVLRAPIPGKVLEVNVAPGEFRNDPNTPLMTIADLSTVWVTADVPESSIRFIQQGERIEIELTAYPGELFPGRVTQIADLVDPQTRTIKVRGELDNRGGRLRPEMYGQIRHIDSVRPTPCVPLAAVVHVQGQSVVFVQSAEGVYQQREIALGERLGDLLPVTSGLKAGEKVVVDGALLLKRGQ